MSPIVMSKKCITKTEDEEKAGENNQTKKRKNTRPVAFVLHPLFCSVFNRGKKTRAGTVEDCFGIYAISNGDAGSRHLVRRRELRLRRSINLAENASAHSSYDSAPTSRGSKAAGMQSCL